jgi:hypothetical protein
VLLAYYKAVQDKSLNSATPYKVKSSDLSGGDKVLKTDMAYSYTYLLDLMMRQQNNNAANIILNKIGKEKVNQTAKDLVQAIQKLLRILVKILLEKPVVVI